MSKDIRSFFKPLVKSKSTSQEKPLKCKPETQRSEKASSVKTENTGSVKTEKTGSVKTEKLKVDDIAKSSDSQKSKEKSKLKSKTKQILEVISSDSDSSEIFCIEEKQSDGKKSKSKSEKVKKIEVVSSDSDTDNDSVRGNRLKSNVPKISNNNDSKRNKVETQSKEKQFKTDSQEKNKLKKKSTKTHDLDSEDDLDIINPTPERTHSKKRKLQIISSDSEGDDTKQTSKINQRKNKKAEEKLKPVSISDVFSSTVKQSKIKTAVEAPETVKKRVKKIKTEIGIHDDKEFEKTLIDLDDDIFLQNEDILDKTIEGALCRSPEKKDIDKKSNTGEDSKTTKSTVDMDVSTEESLPMQSKTSRKRTHEEDDDTPSKSKRSKLNHTDSGFDDQERYEKKKYCAMQYQQYLNRGGPKNHGSKELPKGKPDCLSNLCFLRTGVLDSLESEEFESLIKEHGGKVVHNVSNKVNYVVVGEEPGPTKLQKAKDYKIPTISEDELLDIILQKSGMPKKYTTTKISSFEDAGINDSFVSNGSEETIQLKEKVKVEVDSDLKVIKENIETKHSSIKKNNTENIETNKSSTEEKEIEQKKEVNISEKKQEHAEKQGHDSCNLSLSEKYKPTDLKQIVGQQMSNSNMNRLKKWLECWHVNEKLRKQKKIVQPKPWDKSNDGGYFKCALLSGPPGVGKTTTATLVAESLGFDIVEFNASDTRSKKLLQEEVATALNSKNISSFYIHNSGLDNKRVILMDEVDGMAGNEDRGGMQELINLIKVSKIPIICMCNDRNHQKMRSLANYCFDLRFEKPRAQQILGFVMSICCKEGIKVNPQIATEIINGTTCDIRQTLNQLSMLSNLDTGISLQQAQKDSANAKKDTILGPWQVCKMVFNESDQKDMSLIDKSRLFFYDYSMGPLFVQENYLKVQPHVDKKQTMLHVAKAAEAISMGASIDRKIRESNNWGLLDLQAIYSSVLPGHYMSGNFTAAIDFPSWLGKNSKRNKIKRMNNELSMHTRIQTSGGLLALNLDYSKALLTSIVTPLKKRGLEGVSDAVQVMKTYQLLREDLDSLVELCTGPRQKSLMDGVESKVKAAFTRLYNKEVPIFSYSANTGFSKKKASTLYDDNEFEDEVDETSETEDTIENDNLIKAKSKSKTVNKKETAKPSTSKKKETTSKQSSKAKGKGKK